MSEEQERLLKQQYLLGLALGALEVIRLQPYDFNQDGVVFVISELRKYCVEPVIRATELKESDND